MNLPKDLLDIMACSLCTSGLRQEGDTLRCENARCGLIFPIKEEIPVMLIEEASRPCPKCKATRDWQGDELRCPSCGETFRHERK
jgi:uncharacterized protein YbaR (Trm112 family)